MKKRVEQWLHLAEIDIESAKVLNEKEFLTQTAAFHCQQAVEKLFKSLIENQEDNVPRIHNLEVLFGIIENSITLSIDEEVLVQINEVYIDTRYPSDAGLIPNGKPEKGTIDKFLTFTTDLYKKVKIILENDGTGCDGQRA
jgi:HEPN domain-containing protein